MNIYNERNLLNTSEILDLLTWFFDFFGQSKINRFVKKYNKMLEFSKFTYKEYYLKRHHPWANAISKIYKNKYTIPQKDYEILTFLTDIKMLKTINPIIPYSIQNKYKSDLLDFEHASNYLFEIKVAWQFYKSEFGIVWYEEQNKPEYQIRKDKKLFDVECKRISVDAKRSIKRQPFYRFIDFLSPELVKKKLTGRIEFTFKKKVNSNDKYLKDLSKKIIRELCKNRSGTFENEDCIIKHNLNTRQNIIIDLETAYSNYLNSLPPWSLGVLIASYYNGYPIDPLHITVNSIQPDHYLSSVYNTLKTSIKEQLSSEKPSLLACFIPEISDFSVLQEDSAICNMTKKLFLDQDNKNLIGIIYLSDVQYYPSTLLTKTQYPALKLYNNNFEDKELITIIDSI